MRPKFADFLLNLLAVLAGAALFAGSFPNLLFENGLPVLAWVAYVPVFWLVSRVNVASSVFWGALYGYAAYSLFNYWLGAFHPLAGIAVGLIYLAYFAILFPILRLAVALFPKRGYILQWALWVSFEYVRTLGFLGYSYGITGYSQWRILPIIQIANIFGVWGVSALVAFPSAFIAMALQPLIPARRKRPSQSPQTPKPLSRVASPSRIAYCLSPIAYLALLLAALVYGFTAQADYSGEKQVRLALIQHNTDPWKGGIKEYRRNFEALTRLSDEALAQNPKPDMVVWSETAFVPRIYWHQIYRDDQSSWLLVRDLLDYLSAKDVPFMIGNDDGRREPDKNPDASEKNRVDYNGALLFEKGALVGEYRKIHLVPLTEYFPYRKQLPFLYEMLKNADTHLWEKGSELTVFEMKGEASGAGSDKGGWTFSTPICFEDTFGYISRDFVRNGADIIVNLTNDAWSNSLPAQMQHLSMSVFRAVENKRSVVRATASGQTCGIGPNGKIIAMAKPFTEAQLTVSVPIAGEKTFYTKHGDFLPIFFLISSIVSLAIGLIKRIL